MRLTSATLTWKSTFMKSWFNKWFERQKKLGFIESGCDVKICKARFLLFDAIDHHLALKSSGEEKRRSTWSSCERAVMRLSITDGSADPVWKKEQKLWGFLRLKVPRTKHIRGSAHLTSSLFRVLADPPSPYLPILPSSVLVAHQNMCKSYICSEWK